MSDAEWDCDEGEPDAHRFQKDRKSMHDYEHGKWNGSSEAMTDLSKQVWDDAKAMANAQMELARTIDAAPRMDYCLWRGDVLLGLFGTQASAEREARALERAGAPPDPPIRIEPRVVHP